VNRGTRASTIGAGIAFGFLVTGSGFGNYTTIHQALLLLRSWYLFAVFGSAVAVAAAGLALLRRSGTTRYGGPLCLPHGPARRPHLYGAAIFGAGFGLTGACPGGVVAMVATGGLGGLLVLAGLVGGMCLRGATTRPAGTQQHEATADPLPAQPRHASTDQAPDVRHQGSQDRTTDYAVHHFRGREPAGSPGCSERAENAPARPCHRDWPTHRCLDWPGGDMATCPVRAARRRVGLRAGIAITAMIPTMMPMRKKTNKTMATSAAALIAAPPRHPKE
jgi:hypothetical protein